MGRHRRGRCCITTASCFQLPGPFAHSSLTCLPLTYIAPCLGGVTVTAAAAAEDGGKTWKRERAADSLAANLYEIELTPGGLGFVLGNDGVLLRVSARGGVPSSECCAQTEGSLPGAADLSGGPLSLHPPAHPPRPHCSFCSASSRQRHSSIHPEDCGAGKRQRQQPLSAAAAATPPYSPHFIPGLCVRVPEMTLSDGGPVFE